VTQTFTVAGAASCPLEDGTGVGTVQLGTSFVFTSRADYSRSYASPVTNDSVNLGTLASPGAKGLLVKCTTGSCTIAFQSSSNEAWPLAVGGYFLWLNPSTGFATSAFITTTGPATIIFIAVG
jgi:hypothetical protein